jgi:hypothetical protein
MRSLAALLRQPRLLSLGATALLALGACAVAPSLTAALAYLAPALLLLLVLAARRYPGERALLALMRERSAPARSRRPRSAPQLPSPRAYLPRGGDLLATSLAVRPPPALAAQL